MNGIEDVIAHIKAESERQCAEIERDAAAECERIRANYSQMEQDEYWKYLGAGAKETEKRLEQLNSLAEQESHKRLTATQTEMADSAFDLAVEKLRQAPASSYQALLSKLGPETDCTAESLIANYKESMITDVISALFD